MCRGTAPWATSEQCPASEDAIAARGAAAALTKHIGNSSSTPHWVQHQCQGTNRPGFCKTPAVKQENRARHQATWLKIARTPPCTIDTQGMPARIRMVMRTIPICTTRAGLCMHTAVPSTRWHSHLSCTLQIKRRRDLSHPATTLRNSAHSPATSTQFRQLARLQCSVLQRFSPTQAYTRCHRQALLPSVTQATHHQPATSSDDQTVRATAASPAHHHTTDVPPEP